MEVLLVDDQYEEKVRRVARAVSSVPGLSLTHASSIRDAVKIIKDRFIDLLVVDLQIPSELGEDVEQAGGRKLLEYLLLNKELTLPGKVLGITSHQESFDECSVFFRSNGWVLLLDPDEEVLQQYMSAQSKYGLRQSFYDVAILTALEHTEMEAVLSLPYQFESIVFADDITCYYSGFIPMADGSKRSVIACSAPRMGLSASASLATKVALRFQPKVMAMVGIAAAVRGEAKIGDILVADPSWDWGSGKLTIRDGSARFLSDPQQVPLNPKISSRIKSLAVQRTYLDDIYQKYTGPNRPDHRISVVVGPVASGAVVLEDPSTVELIKSQNRKTVGVEMEAYGLMSAIHYLGERGPKSIVVKSVCDFADPEKNNNWQAYAAYTSAQYLDRLLRNGCLD